MDAQQQIQQIQNEAAARIAAIRAAEEQLQATIAENRLSEEQRSEQERKSAEIAAALAAWQEQHRPLFVEQMDKVAADCAVIRAELQQVDHLLRALPDRISALGTQARIILEEAAVTRLGLADVADGDAHYKKFVADQVYAEIVEGANLSIKPAIWIDELWRKRGRSVHEPKPLEVDAVRLRMLLAQESRRAAK